MGNPVVPRLLWCLAGCPKILASKWQHWDDLHQLLCHILWYKMPRFTVSLLHKGRVWHNTQLYFTEGSTSPESLLFPCWWAALPCPNRTPLTWKLPAGSCAICATPEVQGSSHRLFVQNRYSNIHSPSFKFSLTTFSLQNWSQSQLSPFVGLFFLGFF